jgi:hypothetical protein
MMLEYILFSELCLVNSEVEFNFNYFCLRVMRCAERFFKLLFAVSCEHGNEPVGFIRSGKCVM